MMTRTTPTTDLSEVSPVSRPSCQKTLHNQQTLPRKIESAASESDSDAADSILRQVAQRQHDPSFEFRVKQHDCFQVGQAQAEGIPNGSSAMPFPIFLRHSLIFLRLLSAPFVKSKRKSTCRSEWATTRPQKTGMVWNHASHCWIGPV